MTDVFEKTAKEASKTKNKIAVIIFDELASVIPERSVMLPAMSKTSDQLLKLTDGFESSFGDVFFIIIGLTNHLAQIDKAFKSRSCCIEFLPNKKAIKKVIKANFSDNFLKECKVLKECLDNKYCFGITGKPLAIRDLLNIKKNLFQKTVTQHGCPYKNFNAIPNKVELFHQCYELKNTDEFRPLLVQKF